MVKWRNGERARKRKRRNGEVIYFPTASTMVKPCSPESQRTQIARKKTRREKKGEKGKMKKEGGKRWKEKVMAREGNEAMVARYWKGKIGQQWIAPMGNRICNEPHHTRKSQRTRRRKMTRRGKMRKTETVEEEEREGK